MAHQDEPGLTLQQAEAMLNDHGGIVDIGQVGPTLRRALDKAARATRLTKYRGHWDTMSSVYGMGPLKTIWALPKLAADQLELDAAINARAARQSRAA